MVPIITASANTVSTRLLSRKTPSRLAIESSRGAELTRWDRQANRASELITTTSKKPSRIGPTADWVNECTEMIGAGSGEERPNDRQ